MRSRMNLSSSSSLTVATVATVAGVGAVFLLSGTAQGQEPGPDAEAETSLSFSSEGGSASSSASGDADYMSRYKPTPGLFELGVFVGAIFPAKDHNFHLEENARLRLKSVAPDFGLRVGYLPLSWAGVELEGALMPTKTEDDASATMFGLRGHVLLQLPAASIVPFAVGGFGRLGAMSDSNGDDGDPAIHFGVGAKIPIGPVLGLRLDLRDNITQKNKDIDAFVHHPEVLASLTFTFGRPAKKEAPPSDRDGDGFLDTVDDCPDIPGVAPRGCPIPDTDGDGFLDPDDKCPTVAGIAPDGCPDPDPDKDGILNPEDQCPDVPGVAPDGCPDKDPDKDGILDPTDKCPTDPETKNGFEDADGCPDEIPDEVKKFTGVIKGIEFDYNKATIRGVSKPTLDGAAKVLTDFSDLRVEISGHTDSRGGDDFNLKLSQDRSDAVKAYLVSKGVAEDRIKTRGAGETEPVDDNKTAAGRQKNRRIEFKLLTE